MKPTFKKVTMTFAQFSIALMDWGEHTLVPKSQVELCHMAPKLYENKAIVAIVAMIAATIEFLGEDFEWWGDDHTPDQDDAMETYHRYSYVLLELVFDFDDTLLFYRDRAEWDRRLGF